MIEAINSMLEPLDLNVKKGVDEDDRSNYFILVNTSNRVPIWHSTRSASTRSLSVRPWLDSCTPWTKMFLLIASLALISSYMFSSIRHRLAAALHSQLVEMEVGTNRYEGTLEIYIGTGTEC